MLNSVGSAFSDLIRNITEARDEFVSLQKTMEEVKEAWVREQRAHELERVERDHQEEVERKRELEAYEYEMTKSQRQEEDAFVEKKAKWEKELAERREQIESDRRELEAFRKQVAGFEDDVKKAVKGACDALENELQERFAIEKKLREQEVKGEKDMLSLRIGNLSQENERQAKEIGELKQALESATRQLKEVAVKVIESSAPQKISPPAD